MRQGATLTAIGFDADDTLWQNEHFFKLTEARFAALLADHAEAPTPSRSAARRREAQPRRSTATASRASPCR